MRVVKVEKFKTIIVMSLLIMSMVGCGNNTANKAIEQGKLAMASKEYDKALRLFQLAIDEGQIEEAEKNKGISPKQAQQILYQKVGTHLSYQYAGDLGTDLNVYAESGANFYLFYPSEDGLPKQQATHPFYLQGY